MKVFEPYIEKEITLQQARQLVALLGIKQVFYRSPSITDLKTFDYGMLENKKITVSFCRYNNKEKLQTGFFRLYDATPPICDYMFTHFELKEKSYFEKVAKIIGSDLNESIC